jgi:hypothetical protein
VASNDTRGLPLARAAQGHCDNKLRSAAAVVAAESTI